MQIKEPGCVHTNNQLLVLIQCRPPLHLLFSPCYLHPSSPLLKAQISNPLFKPLPSSQLKSANKMKTTRLTKTGARSEQWSVDSSFLRMSVFFPQHRLDRPSLCSLLPCPLWLLHKSLLFKLTGTHSCIAVILFFLVCQPQGRLHSLSLKSLNQANNQLIIFLYALKIIIIILINLEKITIKTKVLVGLRAALLNFDILF